MLLPRHSFSNGLAESVFDCSLRVSSTGAAAARDAVDARAVVAAVSAVTTATTLPATSTWTRARRSCCWQRRSSVSVETSPL